jgi:D-sedoheptulose 7-phosphate isomerase
MSGFSSYCGTVERNVGALRDLGHHVETAIGLAWAALSKGCKIIFCGNGGSAADCQHLAAELMGRFLVDRRPLPAIALTVDTSALTAIANDYGYDDVFSRQLRGIGTTGDVLVAISTSGNSRNVVAALETAKAIGIATIGLTGGSGGAMSKLCDVAICVPSHETNHIQEMHIVVGHYLCAEIERMLCRSAKP